MIFSEPSIKKFRNDFKISKIKNSEKKVEVNEVKRHVSSNKSYRSYGTLIEMVW
jgi:hypothetical protein